MSIKKSIKNYKEFMHREPDRILKVDIDYSSFIYIGTAEKIEYISDKILPDDKENIPRIYVHKFDRPQFVYSNGKDTLFISPTKINYRGILD